MPMADYYPGLTQSELTDEQVAQIDAILAAQTSFGDGDLSAIDPFEGVWPNKHKVGTNRRDPFVVRLDVYHSPEREAVGPERAKAMADQIAAVVGHPTFVWYGMESRRFEAYSWIDLH